MRIVRRWCGILALLAATAASAHEGSTSYLVLETNGDRAAGGRFDVALVDLAWALPLDGDGDRRLRWREIEESRTSIASFVAEGLRFSRDGRVCATRMGALWLAERLGQPYLSMNLAVECASSGPLAVRSALFFDDDDSHRVLLSLTTPAATHAATLSPSDRAWSEPAAASAWRTGWRFLRQGAWHVWIGYDHLLFLLLLVLPAVVRRDGVAGRARGIALDLARIVTAFTIAHSITLGLAATSVVSLPQRPVEAAIALSLVAAGLLNLVPRWHRFRLPLAFAFGLVHGFGFANALAGLGTGGLPALPVLAGFNVGVELANLAVIATVLPLLIGLARFGWYAPRAMPALSLAAAAVGAAWMLERI
jgi:hypothetical protein